MIHSRLVPADNGPARYLARADALTPYEIQLITEDAVRAGRGARLEIVVSAPTDRTIVDTLRDAFARLAERGVDVHIAHARCGGPLDLT